jgi:hypothetical protein
LTKLISTVDRPKIEHHDVSRGIIKTLITIGFGVSLVAEFDICVNFAARGARRHRAEPGQIIPRIGARTMTIPRSQTFSNS